MSAPSGYTALDFVGFTDKGTYQTSSTYMRNDLVHYGGNIMRCLVDNTTNVTPVAGANWELWIGASANLAERTIAPLENNPADVAFGVGRQIIYDDWLWEVIAPIAVGDALIDYAVDPTNANIKKSAPVETQLLAVKAKADATDNMIAPTEANASSSSVAYSVGDQLILNNILYDVIAAIQIGDALTTGTGGNIAEADSLTDQLNKKANSSDLGTAATKNYTTSVTSGSTNLVTSGAVHSEIQTLTNQVEKKDVSQQHILIVGDSYSDTDPTDFAYIIRDSGIFRQVDLSVGGGRGFTGKEGAPGDTGWELTWLRFFQYYVNGLTDEEKKDIDAVYIIGGFNDHYSTETVILNKMSEFFTWAHANLKTRYYLIQTGWCTDHGNVTTPNETRSAAEIRKMLGGKVTVCYSQAAKFGCTYLGTTIGALHDYYNDWMSDGYHPSNSGSVKLAQAVLGLMLNGKMPLIRDFTNIHADGSDRNIGIVEIDNDKLYFKGVTARFFAYALSDGAANSNLVLDTSIANASRYIASDNESKIYIPCTLQMPDDNYYSTYVYFNNDGVLELVAPCAIATTQRLRIRLMDAVISINNC